MMVKSLDDVDVEITHCDAGFPPGSPNKFPILNTTACWIRPSNGEWIRSVHRSAMQTAHIVRHTNAKDLMEVLGERTEASSGGSSTEDATKLQSLQGHSPSDAEQGTARKS